MKRNFIARKKEQTASHEWPGGETKKKKVAGGRRPLLGMFGPEAMRG